MESLSRELKEAAIAADPHWKWVFWISLVISAVLIIASFLVPPMGIIDASVLAAVGEIFAFPTLYAAYQCIRSGQKVSLIHGNTTIQINDKDD